jgi:predicted O-linked N-acetylglucosamine transferase (SPINDLY family)
VQVTYLASGATGVDAIDYRLTDRFLDPDEADDRYSMEKPMRLAGTYWCYQPSMETGPVGELPARSAGHVTFGCLNAPCKLSPNALQTWAGMLSALGDARLLLHVREGSHRDRVIQFMADRGIAPRRLEFVGRVRPEEYFAMYHRIDIALDPLPCAGGTTTCDALWMGVPVVTLAGRTPLARAGVSILSNAGAAELIAGTPEEYARIAADLARDLPRLAFLRSTLRQRMQSSPLMDADRFAQSVEAAYRTMWRRWCAQ